jgi:CubicO group peptidase (beta-lactamase class C family)
VGGAVVVLVATLGLFGWAWSSVDRSTTARALWWREADVGDQFRFPARLIPTGAAASPLPAGAGIDPPAAPAGADGGGAAFDGFLRRTGTLAFVVVDRDRLVYERYFDGADRQTPQTSFSVAKSFVSTLVGIAIGGSGRSRCGIC